MSKRGPPDILPTVETMNVFTGSGAAAQLGLSLGACMDVTIGAASMPFDSIFRSQTAVSGLSCQKKRERLEGAVHRL